jgi:hypothetical protein
MTLVPFVVESSSFDICPDLSSAKPVKEALEKCGIPRLRITIKPHGYI